MDKKVKTIVAILILVVMLIVHVSYAVSKQDNTGSNSFMELSNTEVSIGENLALNFNLSKVDYSDFSIVLSSNVSLNKDSFAAQTSSNLNISNDNDAINISVSMEKLNLDKITLTYNVSNNVEVGTKIEFSVKVIVNEEDEQGNSSDITILEEKKDVVVTDTKQNNNANSDNKGSNENNGKTSDGESPMGTNNMNNGMNGLNSDGKTGNDKKNFDEKDLNQDDKSNNSNGKVVTSSQGKSTSSINSLSSNGENKQTQTAVYNGSNNNYLSSLEVEGVDLNTTFNKENTSYFASVKNLTSLNVVVAAEDENAKVCISGNENITTGENKILISVTAENGNVRYYRIFVTCESE